MPEDFNKLRRLVKQLVATDFEKEWLFRIELEGEPQEFDLFVKDISYSIFETATDDEQVGSAVLVWPTGSQSVRVSMTCRDHHDGRVRKFIKNWSAKVVHPDGTVGLPYGANGYVKKCRIHSQTDDGSENTDEEFEVYPIQCGEVSRSRENGQFLEFPVTFVQFSNLRQTIQPKNEADKTAEEKQTEGNATENKPENSENTEQNPNDTENENTKPENGEQQPETGNENGDQEKPEAKPDQPENKQ